MRRPFFLESHLVRRVLWLLSYQVCFLSFQTSSCLPKNAHEGRGLASISHKLSQLHCRRYPAVFLSASALSDCQAKDNNTACPRLFSLLIIRSAITTHARTTPPPHASITTISDTHTPPAAPVQAQEY
jgi:hypothetical protein